MVQDLEGEARELEEVSDEAAAVAGWAAKVSVWVENAYAPIVGIEQLTKEARPAMK
jgi:hypothetical protein